MVVPKVPLLTKTIDVTSSSCSAAARPWNPTARSPTSGKTRPTVWGGLKSPIVAQRNRRGLGLRRQGDGERRQGGGSFGRKLFSDAAIEAASLEGLGDPVKLMWHRADEPRRAASTR